MMEFIKNFDAAAWQAKLTEKGRPLGIAAMCFVTVFVAGYGVGKSSHSTDAAQTTKRSLNYTTPKEGDKTPAKAEDIKDVKAPAAAVDKANCYIKGSKSKVYHLPGGSFYERTNPAACFNSEEEAVAAGYKKSSR